MRFEFDSRYFAIPIVVGVLLLFIVYVPFGNAVLIPQTPTATSTPHVVDKSVTNGTLSLDGLPVSQRFRFQNGDVRMAFPIQVEFQRPNISGENGNWTPVKVFNVHEMEWFTVELLGEEPYQIVIEDAEGERRVMGLYIPVERNAKHTVVIGGCCIDDFSK